MEAHRLRASFIPTEQPCLCALYPWEGFEWGHRSSLDRKTWGGASEQGSKGETEKRSRNKRETDAEGQNKGQVQKHSEQPWHRNLLITLEWFRKNSQVGFPTAASASHYSSAGLAFYTPLLQKAFRSATELTDQAHSSLGTDGKRSGFCTLARGFSGKGQSKWKNNLNLSSEALLLLGLLPTSLTLGRKGITSLGCMAHFYSNLSEVKSLSHVQLFASPWTVAYQDPPSMGFSRQECWSGLPFPSPGDLPNPGIEPGSPILQADALPCLRHQGSL